MDLGPYLRTMRLRDQALREARARRAEESRARLPELVRILVEEFHARRVALFGSLTRNELQGHSDIDLAVLGLAPRDYWRALDRLCLAAGRPVDLVPIEEASDSLLARLEAAGEILHG
ncbi:MAG: nucleotidyltransferase domain-containing protein [Myxococcales bacterium]|nr:nucleotidyltransferase domain-containing protein [Myxococcales bacterium]